MKPGFATRADLLQWAETLGAKADLPRLVRRLVLETCTSASEVDFPASEGISLAGFDGIVRASQPTPQVPYGLSLWELSAGRSTDAKATRDFDHRDSTPDGSQTSDATYIALSLRPWQTRRTWAADRRKLDRWRDVRALGVDDIEAWLEQAPVTHAWLSELIGFTPHGLIPAELWWRTWSTRTSPPMPPALVLAGRVEQADELRAKLAKPPAAITVLGTSRDEVLAFLVSAALASTDETLLSRLALVDDAGTWRSLQNHPRPLALIPADGLIDEIELDGRHHVIVPLIYGDRADVRLPQIDPAEAAEALIQAGLPEPEARHCGSLARLSLLAARRRMTVKPELHRPPWARPPVSLTVRRTLLCGWWSESTAGDRRVMDELLGGDYASFSGELTALTLPDDPMLARLGSSVAVVSQVDAWVQLAGELQADDLEAFEKTVGDVLGEADPALELAADERWRAGALGKVRQYSSGLRRGIATAVALAGGDDRTVVGSSHTLSDWARIVTRRLFEAAAADGTAENWLSLADVLPDLAEAAPSEFLESLSLGTQGEAPLRAIFTDRGSDAILGGSAAHSSFLWALERCSWSSAHFGRVVDAVARLAEIDPGGRYANRPNATLKAFFRPFYPEGSATQAERLAALDGLRDRHPDIAWPLLLSLIPSDHDWFIPIAEPRFRDWRSADRGVTHAEAWSFVEELVSRIADGAGADASLWLELIGRLDDLPAPLRAPLLAKLEEVAQAGSLSQESRTRLWDALRGLVARHREYATAEWAMAEDELQSFDAVLVLLEPTAPTDRNAWLFNDELPPLPGISPGEGNFDAYDAALARERAARVAELTEQLTWAQFRDFSYSTKLPWRVGVALAQADISKYEDDLLRLLDSDEPGALEFASGYVGERWRKDGWDWADEHLASGGLTAVAAGRLLLACPDAPSAWERADELGPEVATTYWREFRGHGRGADFSHVAEAARRLLAAGRSAAALDLLSLYARRDEGGSYAELIVEGLEALLEHQDDPEASLLASAYRVAGLFAYLETSELPLERLAHLEWAYLPALGYDAKPRALGRTLAQDPSFFADVVSKVYRPRGSDGVEGESGEAQSHESSEESTTIATNAYRLLSQWRTLPGSRDDGSVDGAELRAWVQGARDHLRRLRRVTVGDHHIGQVLIASPPDPDGTWPCVAVRDLLEELQNDEIDRGFGLAIHNSRGATSRGLYDGGDQERDVAAGYREKASRVGPRWPRTVAVLNAIAESYERQARRHDEEADRRRKGFDD